MTQIVSLAGLTERRDKLSQGRTASFPLPAPEGDAFRYVVVCRTIGEKRLQTMQRAIQKNGGDARAVLLASLIIEIRAQEWDEDLGDWRDEEHPLLQWLYDHGDEALRAKIDGVGKPVTEPAVLGDLNNLFDLEVDRMADVVTWLLPQDNDQLLALMTERVVTWVRSMERDADSEVLG